MLDAGFLPDTISSDVHILSIVGLAPHVLDTMSKFICLGMNLGDVVHCATAAPAKAIGRPELGVLSPGGPGDATVRSEEHTSALQSLMRTSYAGSCLQQKNKEH